MPEIAPAAVAQIRHALEREEYARAAVLWEGWSRELSGRLATGTADPADWAATVELHTWSRGVLLCARAQYQDRLNSLRAAQAYGSRWKPAPAIVRSRF